MKILKTKEDGITLIALVITVIILVILAAVAVSAISGNDGLFSKANNAGTLYNEKAKEEYDTLQELLNSPYFTDEELENMEVNETIDIVTFSFEDNKLTEKKDITIVANATGSIGKNITPGINKVEIKIDNQTVFVDTISPTRNYNKTIDVTKLNNLETLSFNTDYTATLLVTTVGKTEETANCDNIKNYTIGSVDSLQTFEKLVNSGTSFSGEYIFQVADINLNNIAWKPIGTHNALAFAGKYNGNNKKITGLNVNKTSDYDVGLFGMVLGSEDNYAEISNLTVEGTVKGGRMVGGITGRLNYTIIKNCTNKASVTAVDKDGTRNFSTAGGIVGVTGLGTNISIEDCKNYGTINSTYPAAGGIAGLFQQGNISNCSNFGDVSSSSTIAGGIVGSGTLSADNTACVTISNCTNSGVIQGKNAVGGIIGKTYYSTISKCSNLGTVKSTSYNSDTIFAETGGIAGYFISGTLEYSYNTGSVTSNYRGIGGIIGAVANNVSINYCYNIGDVTNYGKETYTGRTGAIVGRKYSDTLTINECYFLDGCVKQGGDNEKLNPPASTADEIKALDWDNFTVDENLNNGFPVLTWETENNNNN